jgi:hypothetical protein
VEYGQAALGPVRRWGSDWRSIRNNDVVARRSRRAYGVRHDGDGTIGGSFYSAIHDQPGSGGELLGNAHGEARYARDRGASAIGADNSPGRVKDPLCVAVSLDRSAANRVADQSRRLFSSLPLLRLRRPAETQALPPKPLYSAGQRFPSASSGSRYSLLRGSSQVPRIFQAAHPSLNRCEGQTFPGRFPGAGNSSTASSMFHS